MRILIAEDEAVSRRVLESNLVKWGYEVLVTCDGREALVQLERSDAPSLAILDLMMPVLSGLEVCRQVRQQNRPLPTYIILLTAKNEKESVVAGLESGADDYISKPYNSEELRARVQVGMRVVALQRTLADRVDRLELAEGALRRLSLTDDLTGLWNRRGFLAHAEHHLRTARRTGKESVLFYADIDGLKLINDTLGHAEGSRAIAGVATILKQTFRESDIVARMGGDEFTVLASDVTHDAESISRRLDENLRAYTEQSKLNYDLSLSLGALPVKPTTTDPIEELIAQADLLMFAHKRSKNRVAVVGNITEYEVRISPERKAFNSLLSC